MSPPQLLVASKDDERTLLEFLMPPEGVMKRRNDSHDPPKIPNVPDISNDLKHHLLRKLKIPRISNDFNSHVLKNIQKGRSYGITCSPDLAYRSKPLWITM